VAELSPQLDYRPEGGDGDQRVDCDNACDT